MSVRRVRGRLAIAVASLCLAPTLTAGGDLLVVGSPSLGGSVELRLTDAAHAGFPAQLFIGLDALVVPAFTPKGPWHIGSLLFTLPLGAVPASGVLALDAALPSDPAVQGVELVLQGYVASALTNPATIPLDAPYLEPASALAVSPLDPDGGPNYGDRLVTGDFNLDGFPDVALAGWWADAGDLDLVGRVEVHWGPDFSTGVILAPPVPHAGGGFGAGLATADVDGDGFADLLVAETSGFDLAATAGFHVFRSSASFSTAPVQFLPGGTGLAFATFGRSLVEGDLDGDGLPEILVGLKDADVGAATRTGAIWIWRSPDYSKVDVLENPTPDPADNFGRALALSDLDGDGDLDIIEGSGSSTVDGKTAAGLVHLLDGQSFALVKEFADPLGPAAFKWFGDNLAAADMDGDGRAEVAVGSDWFRVEVFRSPAWDAFDVIESPPSPGVSGETSQMGGWRMGTMDVNSDGRPDLLMADMSGGVVAGNCSPWNAGMVYAALAPFGATLARIWDPAGSCNDGFGWSFTVADVTGNGLPDLVVGSLGADQPPAVNAGKATILLGGKGD